MKTTINQRNKKTTKTTIEKQQTTKRKQQSTKKKQKRTKNKLTIIQRHTHTYTHALTSHKHTGSATILSQSIEGSQSRMLCENELKSQSSWTSRPRHAHARSQRNRVNNRPRHNKTATTTPQEQLHDCRALSSERSNLHFGKAAQTAMPCIRQWTFQLYLIYRLEAGCSFVHEPL